MTLLKCNYCKYIVSFYIFIMICVFWRRNTQLLINNMIKSTYKAKKLWSLLSNSTVP